MPAQKSSILITGNESPQEIAQRMMDIQRQLDNRITRLEKLQTETNNRLDQLED